MPKKTRRKPSPKDQDDPATRVSVFNYVFPSSNATHWVWYDPIGWVHSDEVQKFVRMHAKCHFTNEWMTKDLMVRFMDPQLGIAGLASASLIAAGKDKYVYTAHGYWMEIKETISAKNYNSGAENGFDIVHLNAHASETTTRKCDYDNDLWTSESMVKIRKSEKYKLVCRKYLDGELFGVCGHCGSNFDADDMQYSDDAGENMCESCFTQHEIKQIIKPHNYNQYPKIITKPIKRFPTMMKDHGRVTLGLERSSLEQPTRLFGVEVETELHCYSMLKNGVMRWHVAKDLMDTMGEDFILAKEDGSLTMNGKYSDGDTGSKYAGFELVTAPADIQTHYARWAMITTSKYYGLLRSWDTETCGFHVHVSRNGMSALQIARIVLFVNHKNNKLFIQKVAGRGSAKYCRYYDKEPKDAIGVHHKNDDNRRQAVNLTNEKTIEFRIFRGTVNPKHILRNIEFCDAICDFCYPASRSLEDSCRKESFLNFVSSNRKRWPLLAAWLALHRFISFKMPQREFQENMSIQLGDVPEHEILVTDLGASIPVAANNF